MPVVLNNASAATLNGIIYVTGGSSTNSDFSVVEAYNPQSDTWSLPTRLPTGTSAAGCAALNGKLFVVGGTQNSEAGALTAVQVFTPASGILNLSMYAGLTLQGQVGATVQINYENILNSTNWLPLTNFALPSGPYLFIDTSSPKSPQRFYQAVFTP
jgi:hypothetical protein